MSRRCEEELKDLAVWFHEHAEETSDLEKRQKFLVKAYDQLIWVMAHIVQDIQTLEGRYPGEGRPDFVRDHLMVGGTRRVNGGRPEYPY